MNLLLFVYNNISFFLRKEHEGIRLSIMVVWCHHVCNVYVCKKILKE